MGRLAFLVAAAAAGLVALPGVGKFLAVGLGVLAIALGLVAWRRRSARPGTRLEGAAAVTVGAVAVLLGGSKVALTLVAVERLATVFH